jgi:hypothetical protein
VRSPAGEENSMGLGRMVGLRLRQAAALAVIVAAAGWLARPALAADADETTRQPLILRLPGPSYQAPPPAPPPVPSASPIPLPNPNVRPPAPQQVPEFARDYDQWRSGSIIGRDR